MSKETWSAYCQYLKDWADSHADAGFEGCPVCFDEFLDCEWQEMKKARTDTDSSVWHYMDRTLNPDELPTKDELLEQLRKAGSCWNAISELREGQFERYANELVWHYPISDSNFYGGYITPVRDGFLFIPYDEVRIRSDEHLLLDKAYLCLLYTSPSPRD